MPYDLEGARASGVPDSEIATSLASKLNYDIGGAKAAGISDTEIANELASKFNEVGYGQPKERTQAQSLGLAVRPAAKAVMTLGGLAPMLDDAMQNITSGLYGTPSKVGRLNTAVEQNLGAMGFPEPETPMERVAQRVAEGGYGVGGMGAVAGAARPVGGMAMRLKELLAQRLGLQTAVATAAPAAGGAVREAGGSPGQELAATAAAALVAPTLTTGKQAVSQRLEPVRRQFQGVGAEPSLGDLTGSRIIQSVEELGMNLPFSRPVLQAHRAQQQAGMGRSATEVGGAYNAQLGRAAPTKQTPEGNVWDSERFLNQWSKMTDPVAKAKAVPDEEIRGHFDQLAQVAGRLRQAKENTVLARQKGRYAGPLGMVGAWFLGGIALPTAILASMTGGAKYALTNPKFTGWLASAAESEGHDIRRRMMQLRTMTNVERDPEMRAAMSEYAANLEERLLHPEGAERNE